MASHKVPKNRTALPNMVACTKFVDEEAVTRAKQLTLADIMAANPISSRDLKLTPGCTASYAVVTYWWGCGNLNKNTQLPCPEDLALDKKPTKPPILFESMIARFGETCRKAGCHYIAKEYPEFAVPGGYQKAINAKPYFIKAALDAVRAKGLRGVVYIDGDMDMKACPRIFELQDIDVALRGWNMDPRTSENALATGNICFDQRTIETSGGTMYFSTSPASYYLLNAWIIRCNSKSTAGKADDRILSELIYANSFQLSMNIIQLPIEYLWLSQSYNNYMRKGEAKALITHPLCLTGEERAADQGAATNRDTMLYDTVISNNIVCNTHGGVFYERVFFDDDTQIAEYKPYLDYIGQTKLIKYSDDEWIPAMYVVKWNKGFGKHSATANANMKLLAKEKRNSSTATPASEMHKADVVTLAREMYISINNEFKIISVVEIRASGGVTDIINILAHLLQDKHVFFHPDKKVARKAYKKMQHYLQYPRKGVFPQFVAVNLKEDDQFKPEFDQDAPMFFAPDSQVLVKMLLMCSNISEINHIFRSSDIFWSRIRCAWIDPIKEKSSVQSRASSHSGVLNPPKSSRSNSSQQSSVQRKMHEM
jgi:hypothetical protein